MLSDERPARAVPFARVEVHFLAGAAVLEAWDRLEAVAACSIYQTRAWLLPWIDTLGAKAGIKPFFVIVRGNANQPLALLCLGLRRFGPLQIATFLGGKDSNFNLPLTRPGLAWGPETWRAVLLQAADVQGKHRPCAYILRNQPRTWGDETNALAFVDARPSPSDGSGTQLIPPADTFFAAKLSRQTRKKLRKKESWLAEHGPLAYHLPAGPDRHAEILDAFFAQKTGRLRSRHIVSGFADPAMRRFIEQAIKPGSYGTGIELHALYAGGTIAAVYGGATHRGSWSGMFNSFEPTEAISRSSPGDLLLMALMSRQCDAGTKGFDLGIGQARYKTMFCGDTIALFDSLVPVTALGRLAVAGAASALWMKGRVKQKPGLFKLALRFHALMAGLKSSA